MNELEMPVFEDIEVPNQRTSHGSNVGLADFSLVPPGSPDFTVYGTHEVVARAREWAYAQEYLLYQGSARSCVHALYRMDTCPSGVCSGVGMDHTNIWVERNGSGAFILTHPYVKEVPTELRMYAKMHSLEIDAGLFFDRWYAANALPIRLTIPRNWPLWPIERDTVVALHASPIAWPSTRPEQVSA